MGKEKTGKREKDKSRKQKEKKTRQGQVKAEENGTQGLESAKKKSKCEMKTQYGGDRDKQLHS